MAAQRGPVPIKLRFRLVVALPAFLSLFVLTASLLLLHLAPDSILPPDITVQTFKNAISQWVTLITVLAFVGNFVAARLITRHLREFMSKMEQSMNPESDKPAPGTQIKAATEIEALGLIIDEASIALSRFVNDSYIIDNLPEAVITVDADGKILRLNHNAARLLKTEAKEASGRLLREFIPHNAGSRPFYRLIDLGFKRERVPLNVTSFVITGREYRQYWVSVHPVLRGEEGHPAAVSITIKDQASITAVRNQIQKIERLAAIGRMAAGIAHEVRNPLGAMRTYTELIQEELSPDDPKASYTGAILQQIERLNRVVEDVLAFSRDPMTTIKDVDIREILSRTVSLAKFKNPGVHVAVDESYAPDLPAVRGDPDRLSQAFLNILVNAFEACHENNGCWVGVAADYEADATGQQRTLCVTIADNGGGIPKEHQTKIFDPFFTLKPGGTGLGLAMTHNIITSHGGRIDVVSESGKGATFLVFLPGEHHFSELQREETRSL